MTNEGHIRKWRLILGGQQNDGTGFSLQDQDVFIDKALEALYDNDRKGSLGPSSPNVARWLGDPFFFSFECGAGNAAGCDEAAKPDANVV
jgi:hypothetical protein